ncbi:hypothetical protein ENBRE01_0598 [Enteropsectra breve]|nr:hypothetical protein ENBRE01_0598 [Enteropsectra breve]
MVSISDINLAITFLHEFIPVSAFYSSILIKNKSFDLTEVSNDILPYFFYSSLAATVLSFPLVTTLGFMKSQIFLAFSQIAVVILLILLSSRNFSVARIMYSFGGLNTIVKTVLISTLVKEGGKTSERYLLIKVLRYFASSSASWIGQDIYNTTGEHDINIILSLLAYSAAAVLSVINSFYSDAKNENRIAKYFSSPSAFMSAVTKIYTRETVCSVIISSTAGLIHIYINIFAHLLFKEKSDSDEPYHPLVDKILDAMKLPVKIISKGIIAVFGLFYKINRPAQEKDNQIQDGFIEGTTKILASIACLAITKFIDPGYARVSALLFMATSTGLFISLCKCGNLRLSKILYFLLFMCLLLSSSFAEKCLGRKADDERNFIECTKLFGQSLLHTLINLWCKHNTWKGMKKHSIYIGISLLNTVAAVLVFFQITHKT